MLGFKGVYFYKSFFNQEKMKNKAVFLNNMTCSSSAVALIHHVTCALL